MCATTLSFVVVRHECEIWQLCSVSNISFPWPRCPSQPRRPTFIKWNRIQWPTNDHSYRTSARNNNRKNIQQQRQQHKQTYYYPFCTSCHVEVEDRMHRRLQSKLFLLLLLFIIHTIWYDCDCRTGRTLLSFAKYSTGWQLALRATHAQRAHILARTYRARICVKCDICTLTVRAHLSASPSSTVNTNNGNNFPALQSADKIDVLKCLRLQQIKCSTECVFEN